MSYVLIRSTATETGALAQYTQFVCRSKQSVAAFDRMSHGLAWACTVNCFCHLCPGVTPTEILQGGVKIIQNRYLSYAPKVNWLDIVKDGTADIMIEDNGPESEWKGIRYLISI